MSAFKVYLILLAVVVTGLVVFQLGVNSLTNPQRYAGCPALSDSGHPDPRETVAFFNNQFVSPPGTLTARLSADEIRILGTSSGEKWIEIDLTRQTLFAHQDDRIILESPISSGLWNKTPVGEYRIWYKVRSTKMEGGTKLTKSYYYLPNVPFAMFFYGDYGIHGTYWHTNFGHPMSHGCVNAPTPVAEKLFYWADPQLPTDKSSVRATPTSLGTRVVVHN